jgi:nucleoside-diphosphate-sugar epimerase
MAREIARQLGRENLLEIGEGARGEEMVRAADVEMARRLLGFEAKISLAEGVSRTIAFVRSLCNAPITDSSSRLG